MPSLGLRSKACHKTIGTPSDGFHEDQFTSPVRLRVENADAKVSGRTRIRGKGIWGLRKRHDSKA